MSLPGFNPAGLLPPGVHPASQEELRERCVTPFPGSTTRERVFTNFCKYQRNLAALGVNATQWADGSFVDQTRVNPEDVDAVNYCDAAQLNALSPGVQRSLLHLLNGGEATKPDYDTHSFLVLKFPAGHPYEANFEERRKYWRDWFSRPQDYSGPVKQEALTRGRKGIVQMCVGDSALAPTISGEM